MRDVNSLRAERILLTEKQFDTQIRSLLQQAEHQVMLSQISPQLIDLRDNFTGRLIELIANTYSVVVDAAALTDNLQQAILSYVEMAQKYSLSTVEKRSGREVGSASGVLFGFLGVAVGYGIGRVVDCFADELPGAMQKKYNRFKSLIEYLSKCYGIRDEFAPAKIFNVTEQLSLIAKIGAICEIEGCLKEMFESKLKKIYQERHEHDMGEVTPFVEIGPDEYAALVAAVTRPDIEFLLATVNAKITEITHLYEAQIIQDEERVGFGSMMGNGVTRIISAFGGDVRTPEDAVSEVAAQAMAREAEARLKQQELMSNRRGLNGKGP